MLCVCIHICLHAFMFTVRVVYPSCLCVFSLCRAALAVCRYMDAVCAGFLIWRAAVTLPVGPVGCLH